jgi:hypothetical protein
MYNYNIKKIALRKAIKYVEKRIYVSKKIVKNVILVVFCHNVKNVSIILLNVNIKSVKT